MTHAHADVGHRAHVRAALGLVPVQPGVTGPAVDEHGELIPNKIDPVVLNGTEGAAVQLAQHVATLPAWGSMTLTQQEFDAQKARLLGS